MTGVLAPPSGKERRALSTGGHDGGEPSSLRRAVLADSGAKSLRLQRLL